MRRCVGKAVEPHATRAEARAGWASTCMHRGSLSASGCRLSTTGCSPSTYWAMRIRAELTVATLTMAILTIGMHRDVRPQWHGRHGAGCSAKAMDTPGLGRGAEAMHALGCSGEAQ
eukprot:scaffold102777_cov60-Phaeocystis_antarctica.AAC.2